VDRRLAHVLIETPRYRIEGSVMLAPEEGYRSRLSDFLNDPEREFLIVLDATLARLDDHGDATQLDVIMLQRRHIDLIIPVDEPRS
jgi:hypothetical protein